MHSPRSAHVWRFALSCPAKVKVGSLSVHSTLLYFRHFAIIKPGDKGKNNFKSSLWNGQPTENGQEKSKWSYNPLFPSPLHLPFLLDKAGSNRNGNKLPRKRLGRQEYGALIWGLQKDGQQTISTKTRPRRRGKI